MLRCERVAGVIHCPLESIANIVLPALDFPRQDLCDSESWVAATQFFVTATRH